jgi:hypothetical protein
VTVRLDWQAFSSQFFPDRRRHDFEVVKAYEAYVNSHPAELHEELADVDGLQVWEEEGGAA